MPANIFETSPSTRPQILTSEHPMLRDLVELPPIADLPAGRVRIRLRADELAPVVHVKTATGIRAFLINVAGDMLSRGPEVAANHRFASDPPQLRYGACATMEEAAEVAQFNANRSCDKWVWYEDAAGVPRVEPAKVLHAVQLNDVVMEGEIIVTERPHRPTMKVAYPGGGRGDGAIAIGFDKPEMENVTETSPGVYDCGPPVLRLELHEQDRAMVYVNLSARAVASPHLILRAFRELIRQLPAKGITFKSVRLDETPASDKVAP